MIKNGQALIEFVIFLVACLALIAGLICICELSQIRINALNDGRAQTIAPMFSDTQPITNSNASFLKDWGYGNDNKPYSADDIPYYDIDNPVKSIVLDKAHPNILQKELPNNQISRAYYDMPLIDEFFLINGVSISDHYPLPPAAKHLLYDADSIVITQKVYMPWTKGIY